MNKKWYKETFDHVTMSEERIEQIKQLESTSRKKTSLWNKTLRYAAAFALVFILTDAAVYAASGTGIFKRVTALINGQSYDVQLEKKTDTEGNEYYEGHIVGSSSEDEQDGLDNSAADDSSSKHLFAINEISGTMSAAKKYYDPAQHYNETWDSVKMKEYLGVDIINAINVLPSGLEMKYTGGSEFAVTYENNGTLVEDRTCYEFAGKDHQKLTVLASKLRIPYDCLYQLDSEKETTFKLHNGDLIQALVAAQHKLETTMEYAFYVVDFEYNGVYYRIETENITSWQLDSLIRAIAK